MIGVLSFNVPDFSARALTTRSIVLHYNVIMSSTLTAEELMNQLTTAVGDGTFDQYLHDAAMENGTSDLVGSSSDHVTHCSGRHQQ